MDDDDDDESADVDVDVDAEAGVWRVDYGEYVGVVLLAVM